MNEAGALGRTRADQPRPRRSRGSAILKPFGEWTPAVTIGHPVNAPGTVAARLQR